MKILKMCLTLCLSMAVLTGCSKKGLNEEEMKALLQEAQAQLVEATSGSMKLEADFQVSGDGLGVESMPIVFSGEVNYKDLEKAERQLACQLQLSLMGMSMPLEFYIQNSMMYTNALGQKVKSPINEADMSLSTFTSEMDLSMMRHFVYAQENGNDVITCELDSESLQSLMKEEKMNVSITCRYVIDQNKNFSDIRIDIDFDGEVEGQKMKCQGYLSITCDKINEAVEIQYPNFSDYQEEKDVSFDLI